MDKRLLSNIGFIVILLLGGLVYAAEHFGFSWGTSVVLIGFLALFGGVSSLISGEAVQGRRIAVSDPRAIKRFRGLSGRLLGLILVIAGLIIIALSLVNLFYPGGASTFLGEWTNSALVGALILGFAGLIVIAFGSIRFLSGSGTAPGYHTRLAELSIRFGGAISILVGLAMVLIAILWAFAPEALKGLFESLVSLGKNLMLK